MKTFKSIFQIITICMELTHLIKCVNITHIKNDKSSGTKKSFIIYLKFP